MRVNPTVTWVTREALEDVEFQGLHIPKGGIVHGRCRTAAGTDPAGDVPDPSLRHHRDPRPPHHGFGAGVHHCLGHFVARTDMAGGAARSSRAGCPTPYPNGPGEWLPVSGQHRGAAVPDHGSPRRAARSCGRCGARSTSASPRPALRTG